MTEIYMTVIHLIEWVATFLLVLGFVRTTVLYLKTELKSFQGTHRTMDFSSMRVLLSSYILMGLDMYIVADLIQSLIEPATQGLLMLGLIVVIRTTIGFFLSRELSEIQQHKAMPHE